MRSHWPLPDLSFHRFRPLNSYAAAKKVSAAPHRGEANRPLRMQGKANTVGTPTKKRRRQKKASPPKIRLNHSFILLNLIKRAMSENAALGHNSNLPSIT